MPPPEASATGLAAIALGSNLDSSFGSPADTLREAVHRLGHCGRVTAVSSFHVTAPVGYSDQPDFTNAACLLQTQLGPVPLLRALLTIEASMGRARSQDVPRNGPRVIDLDLLLYFKPHTGTRRWRSMTMHERELTLPHPRMWERAFVMAPLREIAGELLELG